MKKDTEKQKGAKKNYSPLDTQINKELRHREERFRQILAPPCQNPLSSSLLS